jgi:hypothetical protein
MLPEGIPAGQSTTPHHTPSLNIIKRRLILLSQEAR